MSGKVVTFVRKKGVYSFPTPPRLLTWYPELNSEKECCSSGLKMFTFLRNIRLVGICTIQERAFFCHFNNLSHHKLIKPGKIFSGIHRVIQNPILKLNFYQSIIIVRVALFRRKILKYHGNFTNLILLKQAMKKSKWLLIVCFEMSQYAQLEEWKILTLAAVNLLRFNFAHFYSL